MIKKVELTQSTIDEIFDKANNQYDYLLGLYGKFINFDKVSKIHGFPKVSETTSYYIYKLAIAFDERVHPNVIRGGLWMSSGFGVDYNLPDWIVEYDDEWIDWID